MKSVVISVALLLFVHFELFAQQAKDGQVFQNVDDSLIAWDGMQEKWLTVEKFWKAFAERNGGITWGEDIEYPDYEKVKEFDTFMVRMKEGKCLMQFHNKMWRRAQDVNRWDEKFNLYGACPYVFDK